MDEWNEYTRHSRPKLNFTCKLNEPRHKREINVCQSRKQNSSLRTFEETERHHLPMRTDLLGANFQLLALLFDAIQCRTSVIDQGEELENGRGFLHIVFSRPT
jgi:hypothetical protein